MRWTSDGQQICIVYEDGAIIVGSVDGNRIWGKELKNTSLTGVQWNPDGRLLLFSLKNGEVHLYDNQGSFVVRNNRNNFHFKYYLMVIFSLQMKLNIQCVPLGPTRSISVVGMSWFHRTQSLGRPSLVIAYENGKIQIMRNENDDCKIFLLIKVSNLPNQFNYEYVPNYGSIIL